MLAATIFVGDHELLPNTADQEIPILVSGGDAVNGVVLFLQIGDGGPENDGTQDGPVISGVDLLTDTIFAEVSSSQAGEVILDQVAQFGTITDLVSGTNESKVTPANGLLATLTIDTTGFDVNSASNPWELRLRATAAGNSVFPGIDTTVIDGTISIGGKPTIVAGHHFLKPGMSDQQIEILADGGGDVVGAELFLQVADGGPEVGGTQDGPRITAVDLLDRTIFADVSSTQAGELIVDQVAQFGTLTDIDPDTDQSKVTPANGLLATVTLDTTEFDLSGTTSWDFRLDRIPAGNSSFPGMSTTVINGSITLDGILPTVTLSAPATSTDTTPTVTVAATDDHILPNGTAVHLDADLNNDGDFSDAGEMDYTISEIVDGLAEFDIATPLPVGTIGLRARVADQAGNQGDATSAIEIAAAQVNRADLIGRVSNTGDWYVARSDGTRFTNARWGRWSPNVDWVNVHVADFTGDGKDDVVGRAPSGDWYVARSTGTAFTMEHWGRWSTKVTWENIQIGDFTGDGRLDLVARVSTTGDWWVARSNGNAFLTSYWGKWSPNVDWDNIQVGDFTGDGKDDLVGRVSTTGDWYVAASSGTAFATSRWGKWSPNVSWDNIHVGDFSGDGRDDLLARVSTTGDWYVAQSTGGSFSTSHWGKWSPNVSWDNIQVGDFNGDDRDDLVARVSTTGDWYVAASSGTAFASSHWGKWSPNVSWDNIRVADFTGDGKDDLVARVSTTGDWYVAKSSGNAFSSSHWGKWSPNVDWVDVQIGNFDGASSSAKFAPKSDSLDEAIAVDQFWSEFGGDEDNENSPTLEPAFVDLLKMEN